MGANKKKKKPTASAARGFATTSVASNAKREQLLDTSSTPTSTTTPEPMHEEPALSTDVNVTYKNGHQASQEDKALKDLTPEELEARLEQSELQQLVDLHAARVRKDAARQITRLDTDRRLLRTQAEHLPTRLWLGDENVQDALDAIRDESTVTNAKTSCDELLPKVWSLKLVLAGLGIPEGLVDRVLQHVLTLGNITESIQATWGLTESLDWLAERMEPNNAQRYDSVMLEPDENGIASDDAIQKRAQEIQDSLRAKPKKPAQAAGPSIAAVTSDSDLHVSDTESDLDPDEMVSRYTTYRLRLYKHDPSRFDGQASPQERNTYRENRLLSRMARIQSDPLFDDAGADVIWREKRAQAFQDHIERTRLGLSRLKAAHKGTMPASDDTTAQAEAIAAEMMMDGDSDQGLFEGMFDVAEESSSNFPAAGTDTNLLTRNFGKIAGMSPRRILEEACKARDPGCKISVKVISPTLYHCRHFVLVQWSKDQPIISTPYMARVTTQCADRAFLLEMTDIAASGQDQSEGFACTATFFAIFSGSSKEEKGSLRLPVAFRDLYEEFRQAKQDLQDAQDIKTVKKLRHTIEAQLAHIGEEDVILKSAFKNRSLNASGTATPVTKDIDPLVAVNADIISAWDQKSSTATYKTMLKSRQDLPMYQFREQALDIVRNNQVTILCGETGCGKSTQMPSFILEDEMLQGRDCRIYCTEPRRISAVSLAQRVSEELGEPRGAVGTSRSLVGYAIRLESQTTSSTRLVYATVGIVLRMLESQDGLQNLTHLIIDEVHERSIDTDFLLIVLRSLLTRRPDLKVVLMSATVDAEKFSRYLGNAPIISVPGRTFPVRDLYLEDAIEMTGYTNDANRNAAATEDDEIEMDQQKASIDMATLASYSKSTVRTLTEFDEYRIDYQLIVQLLEKIAKDPNMRNYSKAVLVFLPGIGEIRQLADMLSGHPTFSRSWLLFPLHSTFSNEEQQAAFQVPPHGMRKIVLATNIAETGITIPDVTCVIDTGKHKEMRFDERRQLSKLIQSFISRANAKQRRGRAGRVQEGICFHLFTRQRHDKLMIDQQVPEMLRLSLQDLVMRVKICKLGEIESALSQSLDPPSSKNIRRAIDALVEVGALTPGEELTALGQQISKLPLDAQLGKLILHGARMGCLDFALTTAAIASSKSPFLAPMHARRQADTVRLGFKRGDSDMLTAFNAYLAWRRVCTTPGSSEFDFCKKNFLSPQNLSNIEELKGQLLSSLCDAGQVKLSSEERHSVSHSRRHRSFVHIPAQYDRAANNDTLICAVLAWSFYPKVLTRDGKGWRSIANNQSLSLHPTSVNKLSPSPTFEQRTRYLSFYSIMQSSSRFTNAQEVSPIDSIALVLLAGDAKFDVYAGVVTIDGNRLRFKVGTWKEMAVLKGLRARIRNIMVKGWRKPGREMTAREREAWDLFVRIFDAIDERRSKEKITA